MSNPSFPQSAGNSPPPVFGLPWATLNQDGTTTLTPPAIQFLQELWASIHGTGGIVDVTEANSPSPGGIQAIALALINDVAAALALLTPPAVAPPAAPAAPALTSLPSLPILASAPTSAPISGQMSRSEIEAVAMLARTPASAPQPSYAVIFADLPPPAYDGQRAFITDGSVVAAGNFGTVAAGGGANHVPVYWESGGSQWRIG